MADPDLIHPTYKHLSRQIRLAGLTLTQWTYLVAAGAAAFALSHLLPFSDTYNLSVAITIAGTPAAATLAGATGETHLFGYIAALIQWRRHATLHEPGRPSRNPSAGYTLHD